MIFTVSGPPQYIVVPPTIGKTGDMIRISQKFKMIKITDQTVFFKKIEFVLYTSGVDTIGIPEIYEKYLILSHQK